MQARAQLMADNYGAVKLYVRSKQHYLLGAKTIASGADHFAHLITLAMQEKIPIKQLLNMLFYHPVLEGSAGSDRQCQS